MRSTPINIKGRRRAAETEHAQRVSRPNFVSHDLSSRDGLDLYDDDFIPELATRYGVGVQALMFRLQYLGYIEA